MMRRAIQGATTSRNAAPLKAACLSFSSNYSGKNERRSGKSYSEKKTNQVVYDDDEFTPPPQRNVKNHYAGLFRPRPKKISFTSKFDTVDMEASEPELIPTPPVAPKHHQPSKTPTPSPSSSKKWNHDRKPQKVAAVEAEPVEAIQEEEVEVERPKRFVANQKVAPAHKSAEGAEEDDDDDVLRALEIPDEEESDAVPSSSHKAAEEEEHAVVEAKSTSHHQVAAVEDDHNETAAEGDESMKVVREHPFFKDLVARLNKDMIRFRKDIRASGRYNAEVINTCVRPLLQLTDYPFTAAQIAHLANAINPAVLKSSLGDIHACRRLHLYRSRDTELLLDWSVEDFLRRRYESIHLSWEPMNVVYRRFGWNPEVISDRDCLLFFSNFTDFVDLAELSEGADGQPEALPINDAVARAAEGPLPASRLLIRRKASEDAEPSLTESIRLMGAPALERPHKGKRSHKRDGTVSDMYAAMDDAAAEVDGDDQDKLDHATMSVPSMRQATHPRGRVVQEFSIPKENPRTAAGNGKSRKTKTAEKSDDDVADQDMDSLVSAYHKAKVEVSLLRRRLLRTDDMDQVADLQRSLSRSRAILSKLSERLNEANRGSESSKVMRGEGKDEGEEEVAAVAEEEEDVTATDNNNNNNDDDGDEVVASDDRPREERSVGFVIPTNAPKYRMAPEFTAEDLEKNEESVGAVDIDDEEIENAISSYNAEQELNRVRIAPAAEEDAEAVEPYAAEKDDVVAEDDAEADDTLTAAAEKETDAPTSRLEELALKRERIAGEVAAAEEELQALLKRKEDMEKEMQQAIDDAERTVESLKSELHFIEEEESTVKAQEMEAQLQAQREEQLENLEKQRYEAQKAMKAAEEAAQRQKEAEQAALELEKELLRKLEQVRSRLNGTSAEEEKPSHEHHHRHAAAAAAEEEEEFAAETESATAHHKETHHTATAAAAAEEEEEEAVSAAAAQSAPAASTTTTATNGFMCTPEQYDGLHLAAARLRREIAALETQMEVEGDEDDETLMAVLAESRADLEELNDCIASVQQNASWAKSRDVARAQEEAKQASTQDTEYQRIQKELETHRFNISLLEKRLMHTTSRSVQSKLEQGIVNARRQISALRIAQDKLRRQGATTFGLPSSISMAETLAYEVKKSDAERMAEEVRRAAQNDHSHEEEDTEAVAAAAAEEEASPYAQAEEEEDLSAESSAAAAEDGASASDELKAATDVAESQALQEPFEDAEAEKLRLRLDGMLESIQSLQSTIEVQERANDYDDEETEAVLKAMRDKLTLLMKLRDDIRQRLMQSSKAKAAQNPPTADVVVAAASHMPSPNRVVATTSYPLSPASARKQNKKVFRASKKIRRTAKNGKK